MKATVTTTITTTDFKNVSNIVTVSDDVEFGDNPRFVKKELWDSTIVSNVGERAIEAISVATGFLQS